MVIAPMRSVPNKMYKENVHTLESSACMQQLPVAACRGAQWNGQRVLSLLLKPFIPLIPIPESSCVWCQPLQAHVAWHILFSRCAPCFLSVDCYLEGNTASLEQRTPKCARRNLHSIASNRENKNWRAEFTFLSCYELLTVATLLKHLKIAMSKKQTPVLQDYRVTYVTQSKNLVQYNWS